MKKLIKNKNGSLILLSAIILIISLMSVDMLFYKYNLPDQQNINEVKAEDGGFLSWITGGLSDFIEFVVDGFGALYETMTFQSTLLVNLGMFGAILGMLLWALLIIGLIDILWIG